MSMIALLGPPMVCELVISRTVDVQWGSVFFPVTTLFAGLLTSIFSFSVSMVAFVKHRSWKSAFGIVAAILAIPVTLLSAWLLAMFVSAHNPV